MDKAKGAVPAVVVLAVLSTISGVVTTLTGTGQVERPVVMGPDVMPRGELEQRLGQLELRLNARLYDLRELIVRRTKS
jgi:hypothetical protein